MANFTVYILQSQQDLGYYIGQTEDFTKRLVKHNRGEVRSTKNRRPFTVIRTEEYATRGEARKRENYLKKLKGGNEFKKIINYSEIV